MSHLKKYELKGTENMEYAAWFVTSQTDNHATVTIRGLNKEEVIDNRPKRVCIGQGAGAKPVGTMLVVEIELFSSPAWVPKHIDRIDNIANDQGEVVATIFMYSVEDYKDNDYNDVTIHVAAWKKEIK